MSNTSKDEEMISMFRDISAGASVYATRSTSRNHKFIRPARRYISDKENGWILALCHILIETACYDRLSTNEA